jgi:hypothetical protein
MELVFAAVSLVLSLVAGGVSVLLFLHKEDIHDVKSKIRGVELELADITDRLSVWQRRDAARNRKVAGESADVTGGLFPDQHVGGNSGDVGKGRLRAVARSRGLIK